MGHASWRVIKLFCLHCTPRWTFSLTPRDGFIDPADTWEGNPKGEDGYDRAEECDDNAGQIDAFDRTGNIQ